MHGHLPFLGLEVCEVLFSDDCSDDSASVPDKGTARGDTARGDNSGVRLTRDTCSKLGFSVGVVANVECSTRSSCPPHSYICYVFPYYSMPSPLGSD